MSTVVSAGVMSAPAPPSVGSAVSRPIVPRVSLTITRVPSCVQPSRSGLSSKVAASARGAPPATGTTWMRDAPPQRTGTSLAS